MCPIAVVVYVGASVSFLGVSVPEIRFCGPDGPGAADSYPRHAMRSAENQDTRKFRNCEHHRRRGLFDTGVCEKGFQHD